MFLRQLESLGAIRDMTRYGVQAWEHYFTRWDHNPPLLSLLQSETPLREMTFPTNIDYQLDGKKYKELLRGTTCEGLGYGENQAAILSESGTPQPISFQVDHGKAQFDFGQTTPHKKRVKHRNIMGGNGEVMDVTSMEEDEIKALLKPSE
jgi:hypothetical protein